MSGVSHGENGRRVRWRRRFWSVEKERSGFDMIQADAL